ncbi:galactose mutarotase [Pseudoalteromonas arctica]|uniref:Galactose mutarotase n=1 Tax=Pseudoalteromonas arctica TaxID=394751 RepID=A0AAP6Y5T9_9GAMM|nr:aldose epimerase family protein [Pseudoalteromonas arctica]NMP03939.1 galactose mutarotase [Pseudoalteromonas arctica]
MTTSIVQYTLSNEANDTISIINYGARLTSWVTHVDNKKRNIVLGYSNINDYLNDTFYLGAVAGPYANRLSNAQINIDDKAYALNKNEGVNQLHGGQKALSDLFWQLDYHQKNALSLSITLPDGYNGYPGKTIFNVLYTFTTNSKNQSNLDIKFTITSNKKTIAGPTAHPYFNLNGITNSAQGHTLKLAAAHYTPVDTNAIPTGLIAPVANTTFDYTNARVLNKTDKLDHNFVTEQVLNLQANKQHAELTSADEKVMLSVLSNYPAIQVYTGQHLKNPFNQFDGICLEPQFFPDSPNNPHFPFSYLTPQVPLQTHISYCLTKTNKK